MSQTVNLRLGDLILVRVLDLLPELLAILLIICKHGVDDHPLGRLAHPLEEGEVSELVGTENLEHLQRLVTDILNKVTHVLRHNANVTRAVVESSGVTLGGKDSDTGLSLDEERPLICSRVPVHLPDGAGLDNSMRCSDSLGDFEVGRVGNADLATRGLVWLLVEELVSKLVLGFLDLAARGSLFINGSGLAAPEDVLLAFGEVGEDLGGQVEVLGNN